MELVTRMENLVVLRRLAHMLQLPAEEADIAMVLGDRARMAVEAWADPEAITSDAEAAAEEADILSDQIFLVEQAEMVLHQHQVSLQRAAVSAAAVVVEET